MNPNITHKQRELYEQFRAYSILSEDEKMKFKAKLQEQSSKRTTHERKEYHTAIQMNVEDIRKKLEEIEQKLNSHIQQG